MKTESRFLAQARSGIKLETRGNDGEVKQRTITGYAAVFYNAAEPATQYTIWDDFVERIMPGAFTRALTEDDVRGLFNHNPDMLLGRNTSGTMRLIVDDVGLRYEIDAPDTQCGRDTITSLERKDLTGSSFSFTTDPGTVVWREEDGITIREIHACKLWDVGPVTFPAYEATTSEARALDSEGARTALAEYQARTQQAADAKQRDRDQIDTQARCVELGII